MFPAEDKFRLDLATIYFRTAEKFLNPKYLQQLLNVFADLYQNEFHGRLNKTKRKHEAKAYHLFLECCARGLLSFTKHVTPLCLEQLATEKLLTIPRELFLELLDAEENFTPAGALAFGALGSVFRTAKPELQGVGVFDWDAFRPPFHVPLTADPGKFSDNYRVSWDAATDSVRNSWNRRVARFEEARRKAQENALDQLTALQSAMVGTPLYRQAFNLYPNETIHTPFEIPSHLRFGHQFLVGASRSGKTTFLTAQLMEDLKKVERGECSVIVMDSQNEFVPNISKLALFDKGQPLEGKLVYLEPSQYPIASNIFGGDFRSNYDNVEFFLNSVFKDTISPQQTTMLKFTLQALMHIPRATISTLKDLMEDGGYQRFQQFFSNLDPVVNAWMKDRLYSKDFTVTRTAIRNRLDGFLADSFFRAMFADPVDRLDLFEELKSPKVILVNTADLGGALEPFGRYFIAKLDEAMTRRKNLKPSERLPVFCYIDEASDYIKDEPLIAKIIDKLGKQMLGMIISIQRKAFITSPNVLDALEHVAIQAWTIKPPIVTIATVGEAPVEVNVSLVRLEDQTRMPEREHENLRSEMRQRYGAERLPTAEPAPTPRAKVSPKPEGDETDAKPW